MDPRQGFAPPSRRNRTTLQGRDEPLDLIRHAQGLPTRSEHAQSGTSGQQRAHQRRHPGHGVRAVVEHEEQRTVCHRGKTFLV
jgi:hypothetical protein